MKHYPPYCIPGFPRTGCPAARNIGFNGRGRFVAFIDADMKVAPKLANV